MELNCIAIDGCPIQCARRILEAAGVPIGVHVDLSTLDITAEPAERHVLVHTRRVVEHILQTLHLDVVQNESAPRMGKHQKRCGVSPQATSEHDKPRLRSTRP